MPPGRCRQSRRDLGEGESAGCLRAETFHKGGKKNPLECKVSLEIRRSLEKGRVLGIEKVHIFPETREAICAGWLSMPQRFVTFLPLGFTFFVFSLKIICRNYTCHFMTSAFVRWLLSLRMWLLVPSFSLWDPSG